ncbi:response regulator [Cardiobacteriaceae bacterium TAE3-ERU3]|nr:response regulator [Cardiobacteriaceae bacterium TAE3-ERU3]
MARILIIDDSPTEFEFVSAILIKAGHKVTWAKNATEGIEWAVKNVPDLILMDVVMPGMNGFQATRQLRRKPETNGIPILMLTTKDQETDRIWGLRNGATKYMCKPPSKDELLIEVKELIP